MILVSDVLTAVTVGVIREGPEGTISDGRGSDWRRQDLVLTEKGRLLPTARVPATGRGQGPMQPAFGTAGPAG